MTSTGSARPTSLRVATAVMAVETLALLGVGGWLTVETLVADASNDDVAAGSAAYFLVLGALAAFVTWGLWRRSGWSLGAAVFVQLVGVLVAWTMLQGGLWVGAVLLAALAAAGLVALLAADTRHALGR